MPGSCVAESITEVGVCALRKNCITPQRERMEIKVKGLGIRISNIAVQDPGEQPPLTLRLERRLYRLVHAALPERSVDDLLDVEHSYDSVPIFVVIGGCGSGRFTHQQLHVREI